MYRLRTLIIGLLLLSAALVAALVHEHQRAARIGEGTERPGPPPERCTVCHAALEEGPAGAHTADAVGCVACHLGNALAYDATRAHAGMEPEPGALQTVDRTCGRPDCHSREAGLVASSLMATGRGLIAVNRWVFGETATPDGHETFRDLLAAETPTPAQDHLRKLCSGCHLYARRANRDDAIVASAGTGCSACHSARRAPATKQHPPVDAAVPDERCLGCHSRSGRIALSYPGLAERRAATDPGCDAPTTLHDGRPACQLVPDVHQAAGLACVDCHLHTDLMGDGTAHLHEEAQVEITCEACHGPVPAGGEASWAETDDAITRDRLRAKAEPRPPLERVRLGRRGTPVWNLRPQPTAGASWTLTGKRDGRPHPVRQTPADANHQLPGHERLTCAACHSAWAPTCTTCHTRFAPDEPQWDFAHGEPRPGAWHETAERYGWGAPALAVTALGRIAPAIPGMILTLQRRPGGATDSRRLFAVLDPHTTRKASRSCASCHSSGAALGLGTGTLEWGADETPRFAPTQPVPGRPELATDGWTTLGAAEPAPGTRTGVRSLDAAEQQRVLAVSRCLPCHEKADDPIYRDFRRAQRRADAPDSRCTKSPPGRP